MDGIKRLCVLRFPQVVKNKKAALVAKDFREGRLSLLFVLKSFALAGEEPPVSKVPADIQPWKLAMRKSFLAMMGRRVVKGTGGRGSGDGPRINLMMRNPGPYTPAPASSIHTLGANRARESSLRRRG